MKHSRFVRKLRLVKEHISFIANYQYTNKYFQRDIKFAWILSMKFMQKTQLIILNSNKQTFVQSVSSYYHKQP